jgi:hypothetical protein
MQMAVNKGQMSVVDYYERQVRLTRLPDFSWHNIPKRGKRYQIATKLPNGRNIFKIAKENTNLFHSKALQNLSKLRFLVWKRTIWQPWTRRRYNQGC